ncbi:hypothetical protein B9Z55_013305 [Caenorhabditis nigoni]|uniref:Uncharacterized protein n=1 Tax=Caenorhabditis nigoni TaxID=1611254 RepID=A0A2G5U148_9PELO|nr:hypothetical protein B9Z55_013305 [Caenorhabditis nigoni]
MKSDFEPTFPSTSTFYKTLIRVRMNSGILETDIIRVFLKKKHFSYQNFLILMGNRFCTRRRKESTEQQEVQMQED